MKKSPTSKKTTMNASTKRHAKHRLKKETPPKKESYFGGVIYTSSGTIEENVEEQSP